MTPQFKLSFKKRKKMSDYNFNSVLWNKSRKYEEEILDESVINDMKLRGMI